MSGCANILPKRRANPAQFKKNVAVTGLLNCINLDYDTPDEFEPNTLEVILDGNTLTRDLDYTENANNKSFTLLLSPTDSNRLSSPPESTEELRVNYIAAPSGCVVIP